jgi:hypothetical protein
MNQSSEDLDLDRRLAEQRQRSKLRHVEFMEWIDQRHQQEKRSRRHYERFRWLYWSAGAVGVATVILGSIAWGWIIGTLIASQLSASRQPGTVVIQMQPPGSPEPGGKRP